MKTFTSRYALSVVYQNSSEPPWLESTMSSHARLTRPACALASASGRRSGSEAFVRPVIPHGLAVGSSSGSTVGGGGRASSETAGGAEWNVAVTRMY